MRTVGELEVIAHIERGKPHVDTRLQDFFSGGTTPRARNISHKEILEHVDQLDPTLETVFFCDGRQCSATPDAIRQLLERGYPPRAILYYRDRIHDWVTLGLPLVTAAPSRCPTGLPRAH